MADGNNIFQKWRTSLTGQVLIRFWISLIIFLTLIGGIQYRLLHNYLYNGVESSLVQEFKSISSDSEQWLAGGQTLPRSLPDLNQGHLVLVYGPTGELRIALNRKDNQTKSLLGERIVLRDLIQQGESSRVIRTLANGEKMMLLFKPITRSANLKRPLLGTVVLAAPLTSAEDALRQYRRLYLLTALGILFIGGLFTSYILRKPVQPLANIAKISRQIAAGQYSLRIPEEKAPAEIESLRIALNLMLDKLNSALKIEQLAKEQMSRFISDASHELRTPLTSLRGFLEILERSVEPDPGTIKVAHQTMLKETERLIRMVEDLLTMNRLAQAKIEASPISRNTKVQEIIPELLPLLNSISGSRLIEFQKTELAFPLEPDELKQILINLVSNAIQYTPDTGQIQVGAYETADAVVLSVSDDGEGIAPIDQPYLFERFYRGSSSRKDRSKTGVGLGLAIVHDIVQLRDGEIHVNSTLNKGSTFLITFPKLSGNSQVADLQ